ncbi:MAG: protein kinase [Novosphingobium sp.]|nr:protein kinase [Novosphingobium sp.]
MAGGSPLACPLPPATPASGPARLAIELGQFSTAGRKDENQDFHGALRPEGVDLATKGIAICLADGISTSALGAAAAETAVKTFLSDYYCTSPAWSVRTSGDRVIAAGNSWMYAQNRREMDPAYSDREREKGLICTFTALVLKARSAYIFHVGDCRVIRISGETCEELTEPHRVELGGGVSYLGRALGVNRNVEVDFAQVPVAVGDLFVLSSDGVHDVLTDCEISRIIDSGGTLDAAAKAIAQASLDAGSEDNITVQVVRIEGLPDGDIDDIVGQEAGLPPAPQLTPGAQFEGYAIESVLHSGNRSHVYLARDTSGGRQVALKVLSTEMAQDPAAQASLMLEEWVMRRLDHPNLLKAPPPSQVRRHAYSVSDFVSGQSLRDWMLANPRPELDTVRAIIRQIAAGVLAMHRREMVHRDLRPQNILICPDERITIIDFGSVQVNGIDETVPRADDAMFAGTMQYSAPELYLGYPATSGSDLYSLGVIAYQLLTGDLPYGPRVSAATTQAAQRKLAYYPVTDHNPDVPDWMDAAIRKAVSVNPANRYDELSEFVVDLAKPNPGLSASHPIPLLDRGSVLVWQLISAALVLALVVSILTRPSPVQSPPETPRQETTQ